MATARGVTPLWKWARTNARIRNEYVIESLAEFLGTAVLCFYAFGCSAQFHIMNTVGETPQPFMMAVFGGVFGLMIAVFIFGGISGAHLNPAVSLGLAIAGEVSWLKLPAYIAAQMFGAYIGSLLGYALYIDDLINLYGLNGSSMSLPEAVPGLASLFSPLKPGISLGVGIADQTVCVAVLLMSIFALIDKLNMKVQRGMLAFFVCLVVSAQAFCYDVNAGAVLNPARDLGPRLAALTVGFKVETVMENIYKGETQQWWLVGLIGPMLGGAIGTIIYIFCVGAHLKDEEEEKQVTKIALQSADPGDWRSTQFVPKVKTPNHNNNGVAQHQPSYLDNNNIPHQYQGHPNQGYQRGPGPENVRYPNGYQ